MTLTVMTWLWSQKGGRTGFTHTHVNIWAAMLRRHCTMPLDIACVTDMPDRIDASIRIIAPPGDFVGLQTRRWRGGRPNCYRRLSMFRRDAADIFGSERFVSMDLDVVISGNIDAVFSRSEPVVLCAASHTGPRWRYNGSMVMLTAGARPEVYEMFTPELAERASSEFVGSDQAWLGYALGPGSPTWGEAEGVGRYGKGGRSPVTFFPGTVKPWDVLDDPWVATHYRLGSVGAKAAVVRHSEVLGDVETARYIVAYPGAAERLGVDADVIVETRAEEAQALRMLGVSLI